MKAVLFHPRIENSFRASYAPLGIMSIATYLNANGHEAVICDRFFETDKIETTLKKHSPDMVGVSITSHSFISDAIVISKAANKMGIPVVWGGSLSSAISFEALKSGFVDYVSYNEGEETWLEMANAFDAGNSFEKVKGLGFLRNGELVRTEDRDFVDLSRLPDLDWTLVTPENYFQKSYGYNKMLCTYLSKGCTGRCAYCYNPEFHRSTRRCRPLEQVIREMRLLVEKYGADGFDFTDDLMFANRNEVVDFCNALIDGKLNICWSGYLSFGILNDLKDYELMYKAGCRSMIFGVESGSEKILRSVNKSVRLEKVKNNVVLCLKAGIVPITMFIIGLPGEDEEDIRASLELAKSLKGASVGYGYFTPLPGTKAYRNLVAEGKMKPLTTLEEHAAVRETEKLLVNVTNVKTVELITVRKYIRLRGIFTKTGNSMKEQLLKVILSTCKSMFDRGFVHFLRGGFNAVFNVLRTFTIFFHPKIRKKYGLYFKK